MKITQLNLYEAFGLPAPSGAAGTLEIWCPEVPEQLCVRRQRPGILILPGGAYRWTSEREAEAVALRFAARGFTVAILRYSCAPHAFPVSLREACIAMRYLRAHADALELDPRQIAALGFSAGGHLCGTLGTLYDAPEVADLGTPDLLRPDALVLCYPVSVSRGKTHEESFEHISGGNEALRDRLSLDRLVRSDMPPVFLWHTRDDHAVPCAGSLILARALEDAGVEFAFHLFRKGIHGLSTADAQVYPSDAIPETSPGLGRWPETAMGFLAELGFSIHDTPKSEA